MRRKRYASGQERRPAIVDERSRMCENPGAAPYTGTNPMKVIVMEPFVAYSIFVFLAVVLALWAGKQIKAETKRIAAKNALDSYR